MMPFTLIAERIKYFRSLRRKTQVSLASEASIDYRHFQKLEAGQSDFKISTVFKLSKALAIPPCFLLQLDPFEALPEKYHVCPTGLLNQLEVGVVAWDHEGKLLFCNKQFCDLIHIPTEDEAIKTVNMNSLFVLEPSNERQVFYHQSAREGKIKSDFIRTRVKLPSSDFKTIFLYWNCANPSKASETKAFVAVAWSERECHDFTKD